MTNWIISCLFLSKILRSDSNSYTYLRYVYKSTYSFFDMIMPIILVLTHPKKRVYLYLVEDNGNVWLIIQNIEVEPNTMHNIIKEQKFDTLNWALFFLLLQHGMQHDRSLAWISLIKNSKKYWVIKWGLLSDTFSIYIFFSTF